MSNSFRPPSAGSLPSADASVAEVLRFIGTFDMPLFEHIRQRWGAEYRDLVQARWGRGINEFSSGQPAVGPVDELLLCLAYDAAVGPYLGVPESDKLPFWLWLIDGVRRAADEPATGEDGA